MDEVVVVGAVASVGAGVGVGVEELSEELGNDVDAPSTARIGALEEVGLLEDGVLIVGAVEVELTNGGALVMYDPFDCTA